jgi:type II secretory pathway component PulF
LKKADSKEGYPAAVAIVVVVVVVVSFREVIPSIELIRKQTENCQGKCQMCKREKF